MARTGIEYKDVERSARRLFSQGITPSVQRVRNELGTGSNTTIAKHLNTWRESFSESRSPALPESVPEDLMNPLDDFWSTAVAKAESNYQKYKEDLEVKLSAMDAERLQAIECLNSQTQENALLTRELEEAQTALQELERTFCSTEGENGILKKELEKSHQVNEQMMATVMEQQQSFNGALSKLDETHQEEINNIRAYSEKTENRLLVEIDQLRQRIKKSDTEKMDLTNSYVKQIDDQKQRETKLQTELHELRQANERITAESSQANKYAHQTTKQITSLQTKLTQALDTIAAFSDQFGQIYESEKGITEKISSLSKSISMVHNDIKENANEHPDKD